MCDEHFNQWVGQSSSLNRFYIETRYPADIPLDIDTETIDNLMNSMTDMLEFITEQIRFDFVSYHRRKK